MYKNRFFIFNLRMARTVQGITSFLTKEVCDTSQEKAIAQAEMDLPGWQVAEILSKVRA